MPLHAHALVVDLVRPRREAHGYGLQVGEVHPRASDVHRHGLRNLALREEGSMTSKKKLIGVALLFASFASCHKAHQYEATVELTRITTIRKDEQGVPLTADLE